MFRYLIIFFIRFFSDKSTLALLGLAASVFLLSYLIKAWGSLGK